MYLIGGAGAELSTLTICLSLTHSFMLLSCSHRKVRELDLTRKVCCCQVLCMSINFFFIPSMERFYG